MASESAYPLRSHMPYNRIIAFTEIYIPQNGNTWRNPKGTNDSKLQGEVAKWNAADSTVKAIPAFII
jgi:hypothetical protein